MDDVHTIVIKAHVFVEGKVQGVVYRSWVKRMAEELKVNGWVKNLDDGRVEAIFEGPREKVDELIELCKIGSEQAKVKHVDVIFEDPDGDYVQFVIL
jgi:acylphosphatase